MFGIASTDLSIFLAAMITLNLTPGPDILYVMGRSIGQGRTAGVISALGIFTGCLFHILAAAFGISVLLAYSAAAFLIVKYAGAGYLIYLGARTLLSKSYSGGVTPQSPGSKWRCFYQGVITNALNPKVALFFLSFLPQFVSMESGNATLQLVALGLMFDISGTAVCIAVALVFGYAGSKLIVNPAFDKMRRYISGTIFMGLGIRLAFLEPNR